MPILGVLGVLCVSISQRLSRVGRATRGKVLIENYLNLSRTILAELGTNLFL